MPCTSLEVIAKQYFHTSKKNLDHIQFITPGGNDVKAWINRSHNRYMGSMYIYEVNGKTAVQFVRSMPKIHYWDDSHQFHITNSSPNVMVDGNLKYDGSCIIIYALKNADKEIIEVVPKSRNMGVLDKNLQRMYNDCDTLDIRKYITHTGNTLFFELHGIRNRHTIVEMDTYCQLTFIGEVSYEKFNGNIRSDSYLADDLCGQSIDFAKTLFEICMLPNNNIMVYDYNCVYQYGPYMTHRFKNKRYTTVYEALDDIKLELDHINDKYLEENNRIAIEGIVFNGVDKEGEQIYIKLKPTKIEEMARSESGVPKYAIRKECYKFLDEYGSEAKDLYLNNPEFIWDYINDMLSEEFGQLWIDKSQNKIKKTFLSVLKSREIPESIQNICHKLLNDNPNLNISDLMREFARQYPLMKNESRVVYSQLNLMIGDKNDSSEDKDY